MEIFDALSLFSSGAALGILIGHWLARADRRLDYERGRLDGINELWPHLVSAWIDAVVSKRGKPSTDTQAGSGTKPELPAQ
ncbi:MAG: hypothetical protein E6Q78_05125 [Rhodoferax sp.]|nr:MAG: hypothetical protein E6Q78_05125 [Rhodoferax sp.]